MSHTQPLALILLTVFGPVLVSARPEPAPVVVAAVNPGQPTEGWQIPPNAASEANPLAADDSILAKGQRIYRSKCQRCHGPQGRGDGPEADPGHPPGNLADAGRAARNPDGVIFYKVWNGRRQPKMPAFKTELSREEVWQVTHYVKTLRR